MNYEKEYYEFDGFWADAQASYILNREKIHITIDFIKPDVVSVLDAACGNGVFTNYLAEKFPQLNIAAFDRSESALKHVKTNKKLAEINNIPFEDKSFDCVVAHDVIEHLPVPIYETSLHEIARVAKKYIIIGVPNNEQVMDRSTSCPSCKAVFNYDLHMRSFTNDAINSLFEFAGFQCMEIRTCDKNTFYYGQNLYSRLAYPSLANRFKSPICPICGYSEKIAPCRKISSTDPHARAGLLQKIKSLPKFFWPRYSKDYELVALYKKKQ